MLALVALNIRPVRVGALVLNTATWIKVGGLVALAALAYALSHGIDPGWRSRMTLAPHSWPGFGLALILVMGAYDGWQWVPQLAEELKNPARAPRASAPEMSHGTCSGRSRAKRDAVQRLAAPAGT